MGDAVICAVYSQPNDLAYIVTGSLSSKDMPVTAGVLPVAAHRTLTVQIH